MGQRESPADGAAGRGLTMTAAFTRRGLTAIANTARLRTVLLVLVSLGAAAIAVAGWATHALSLLESGTVDARFAIRGRQRSPSNIVIVKIDDATFQDLGLQWPFPRRVHARVIARIAAQHPAAILYDVQFTEASERGQADDLALLNAINNAGGKVVFATTETTAAGGTRFLGSTSGTKLLHEVHSSAANGLFPYDAEGVIRHMSYAIDGLDTLAVAGAEVATHRRIPRSSFASGHDWIDFTGPAGSIHSVSFAAAYRGHQLPPHFFTGKIVVVGATAPSLQDIHPTSVDGQMAGPEIQANAVDTVLRGMPLSSIPAWADFMLIVLLAIAVPLASVRAGMAATIFLAAGLAAILAVGVQVAFDSGRVVVFVYPLLGLILAATGTLAVRLLTEAFERIRVRDLFARFVPENVVDEILASAGPRLGGVERMGTVMFSDLRGFTTLAESQTPARVIEILNRYLSEMSDAILDHGGTLVAYLGDGIMAVFGAPLPQADHADRAVAAAREMLHVRLPSFNAWLRREEISDGLRMGIGLNSGFVMSGHVGSERRVEYTVVGDTTNTASRIEGLTKGTPHQLLIATATRDALVSPDPGLIRVGESEIRGRTGRLVLWSVRETAAPAAEDDDPERARVSSDAAKATNPVQPGT